MGRVFMLQDAGDGDYFREGLRLQAGHAHFDAERVCGFARSEDSLCGRLTIEQGKGQLTQLRALVSCGLYREVRRRENGIHYRTRDQRVSARHSARVDSFLKMKAEP